ncbi:MAG TPA: acyl carrier protein [Xanthomonadaceae bacterium]|jgi:acyl carrier protein
MSNDIKDAVERVIRRVAEERGLALPALRDDTEIVDELGFSSLVVAALIASLEEELGFDPFQDEDVMITDVRTFGDLCRVYADGMARIG